MEKYFITAIKEYVERTRHYIPFEMEVVSELKNTKSLSESQQKEREADLLLRAFQPGDFIVLLDEHGKEYRSIEFARQLQNTMSAGGKDIIFIIGGAYGFSDEVYARADGKISLSKMTFSHQMVRAIFAEQLYRAFTIIKGEPYHHE